MPHLDTGLLYRAVGMRLLDSGLDPADAAAAEDAALALSVAELSRPDLRGPAADAAAAAAAAIPGVRAALLDFQRGFGARTGAVLDGRDIGTVIHPDAAVKFWITATAAARGHRRWVELRGRGVEAAEADVVAEVIARDARDAVRLVPAADARVIDTSGLDADATFARALAAFA